MKKNDHKYWMKYALQLAFSALKKGEVPVGAVLVYKNKLIGKGLNSSIKNNDPTAHAEILALRQGGVKLKNYRLVNCTLYVTLEPCIMCYGAMVNSRIKTLVFGAHNKKSLSENLLNKFKYLETNQNHRINIISGINSLACSKLLNCFFSACRLKKIY